MKPDEKEIAELLSVLEQLEKPDLIKVSLQAIVELTEKIAKIQQLENTIATLTEASVE